MLWVRSEPRETIEIVRPLPISGWNLNHRAMRHDFIGVVFEDDLERRPLGLCDLARLS